MPRFRCRNVGRSYEAHSLPCLRRVLCATHRAADGRSTGRRSGCRALDLRLPSGADHRKHEVDRRTHACACDGGRFYGGACRAAKGGCILPFLPPLRLLLRGARAYMPRLRALAQASEPRCFRQSGSMAAGRLPLS